MDFYGTRREDLLGSMVSALTDGRVSKVQLSKSARTGYTAYDTRTGQVQGIVLPQEENLPEGCTMEAAHGLMDHEAAHALFTTMDPGSMPAGLLMQVANILEDPRVEKLFMRRYVGAIENIDALTDLGFKLIGRSLDKGGHGALDLALLGLSLEAYGQDAKDLIGTRPHASEVLAFLDSARPHVAAALKSTATNGVIAQSKAIVALLKDASAHVPPPPPAPAPAEEAEQGEGDAQESGSGGEDGSEDLDESGPSDCGEAGEEGQEGGDAASPSTPSKSKGKNRGSKTEQGEEQEGEEEQGTGSGETQEAEDRAVASDHGEEGEEAKDGAGSADDADLPEGDATTGSRTDAPAPSGSPEGDSEGTTEAHDHNTDPLSKGGCKPSALAQEAMDVTEGFDPKRFNPAEAVMDQLKDAINQEIKRLEKEKQEELLKAQRSGLVCPIGTTPAEWRSHEQELRQEANADCRLKYPLAVDQLRPVIMGVRHALRIPLMAQGRSRVRTGREYGDLNPADLVHVALGTSNRVFQVVQRGKTSKTAVFLLVDQSGSMNGPKIMAARMAAVALSEALCGLPGLHTEIGGFTHSGGVSIHRIAKTFRERKAEAALALGSGGGNADGSAVRWAARRLLSFKADRRILIVLSDGWPTDGPQPAADLRAAVEAAEHHGIETMGIGILDNSVEAYYPKHVVLNQVEDLSGAVLRALAGSFTPEGIAKARTRVRAKECA